MLIYNYLAIIIKQIVLLALYNQVFYYQKI